MAIPSSNISVSSLDSYLKMLLPAQLQKHFNGEKFIYNMDHPPLTAAHISNG